MILKLSLLVLVAVSASAQAVGWASSSSNSIPSSATFQSMSKANRIVRESAGKITFKESTNDDYLYIAVLAGSPAPVVYLGQFILPLAGAEEGFPKTAQINGVAYSVWRSYNAVGGVPTTLSLSKP